MPPLKDKCSVCGCQQLAMVPDGLCRICLRGWIRDRKEQGYAIMPPAAWAATRRMLAQDAEGREWLVGQEEFDPYANTKDMPS